MDQRAAPAASGGKALRQHAHHRGKILARKRPIGPGPAQARKQRLLFPFSRGDFGDDLLGEHVERLLGNDQAIELAAAHAVDERRGFDEIVARERKQPPLGQAVDRVAGAADPLQKTRDRARRADLADEIDLADVDAEFERGGCDQRFELAALETLLGVEPLLLGETAMMRGEEMLADALGKLPRHPLGHAAGVDEDQRGAVRLDQLGQAPKYLLPDFGRHHGFERRIGNFDGEVACPAVADVDDRALAVCGRVGGLSRAILSGPDQEARHRFHRLLRRGEADPQQSIAAQRGQALERKRQMAAAFVRRDGVDLVDDHRARGRQHGPAGFGAEQDVKRLRRGNEDVRRPAAHAFSLTGWSVACAYPGPDLDIGQPPLAQLVLSLLDWVFDATKNGKPLLEIEQQPCRPRIAVPRLTDRAGIEQPSPLELHLGLGRCETACDLLAVERQRERDMAVADEHERGVGELERCAGGLFCQHVFPDRIARACMEEIDAVDGSGRLEPLQESARFLGQDTRRPGCRRRSFVIELSD